MLSRALIVFFFFTTCSATVVPGNFIRPESLWATSTCGEPPELSCLLHAPPPPGLGQLHATAAKCYECRPYEHLIKNIVSGNKDWWQSANNISEVNITIFLPGKFYILAIILDVGPARMPRQWVLEKSVDNENFTPWRAFGDKPFCKNFNSKQPQNIKLHCSDKMPSLNSEKEIIILLNDIGISFCSDIDSTGWFEASAIRLRFQKFETFHGDYLPNDKHFERFLYYTLKNVEIYGENATATDCIRHLLPLVNEFKNMPVAVRVKKNVFGRLNSVRHDVKIIDEDCAQIKKSIKTSIAALNFVAGRRPNLEAFSNELLLANTTLGLANKYRTKFECIDQLKCRLNNIQSSLTSIITKLSKQKDFLFEREKSVLVIKKLLVNFIKLKEVLINELQPSVIHGKQILNSSFGDSIDDYFYIYNDGELAFIRAAIEKIEYKKDLLIRKLNYQIQEEFELTSMLLKSRQRVNSLKFDLRKKRYEMRFTELILQDVGEKLNKINKATPQKIILDTTTINISANTDIGVLKHAEFSRLKTMFNGIFEMIDTIYSGVYAVEKLTGKMDQLKYKNELILQKQATLEDKLESLKTKINMFNSKNKILNELRKNN